MAQGLPKAVFGLEPTANYHKPLGEHLIKCGRMVVLVSGVAVKRNRELLDGRWDKHDTKDAANIADLISHGYLLTIPGFGPDVSAKVIGAIGNPFRFQNRKQVLKLAGLDLSADRSGKTADSANPVISYLNVKYGHRRETSVGGRASFLLLPSSIFHLFLPSGV